MEERTLHTILLEFQKLNKHLDHIEESNQNKFDLMDARFNTLEGLIVTMQNDIGALQKEVSSLQSQFDTALQDIQSRMSQFDTALQDIQNRMSQFDDRLKSLEKITLQMEYDFHDKIPALFDAYSYHNDQYQKLETRIRQNEIKIANLSLSSC